ncbi:MAG: M42 family metallopeptidase [Bacteroidetes bacterium]|nr:M42 family metallopeptidase [Rhodothermia bacterium]MCS7155334.1 M42 family metallopeptidase [Bacteroidota bacterium]MCX7907573.1 M42 family metallopeptidase [Bacteroidota bacterium]MDW8138567.1 M42 family metallopeptidase [Bacteroidota bacterium]MDW8284496.1 M42 family metallopeptidase [Bacteroidota bacterium]
MERFALLKRIVETPGAPGREAPIREVVLETVQPLVDEVRVDALGNVIARKRGRRDRRVLLAAHMDEIAFMVNHIDDRGFIRFVPLGGFDPKTLVAQRVLVHGRQTLLGVLGTKPVHVMTQEERKKVPELKEFFVDLGLPAERVRELVRVGDVITRERELVRVGDTITGKSLDNRLSVFVLLEALRELGEHEVDIYAVFTVQEEVGLRGSRVVVRQVQPHVGIALDITLANDIPGIAEPEQQCRLGKGTAIKVMDASAIADARLIEFLIAVAEVHQIPYQLDVSPAGGTDTAGIQYLSGDGVIAGCLSTPTRYVHSVTEMAHVADIQASIRLLARTLERLHEFTP